MPNTRKPDEYDWPCHPDCQNAGKLERLLIDNREECEIVATIVDDTRSYEYDDFALVKFNGEYYLLETSGCSCPSPRETWGVVHGPTSLKTIKTELETGNYKGFTVPDHLMREFLNTISAERRREKHKK